MKRSVSVALMCLAISLPGLARTHGQTHAAKHVKPTKHRVGHYVVTPTAVCKDGTASYGAQHRGTCSHHGGVRVRNR